MLWYRVPFNTWRMYRGGEYHIRRYRGRPYMDAQRRGIPYKEVQRRGRPYMDVQRRGRPYTDVQRRGIPYTCKEVHMRGIPYTDVQRREGNGSQQEKGWSESSKVARKSPHMLHMHANMEVTNLGQSQCLLRHHNYIGTPGRHTCTCTVMDCSRLPYL